MLFASSFSGWNFESSVVAAKKAYRILLNGSSGNLLETNELRVVNEESMYIYIFGRSWFLVLNCFTSHYISFGSRLIGSK